MAELRKTVLGKVSGAIGDIVFRERDGMNYISTRPSSFIPGTDPASIARRQRFAMAAKTSVSINRIPELKVLWGTAAPSGVNPYNYIFKTNYRFVSSVSISDLLQLVPGYGFGVNVPDSTVDRAQIAITMDLIGDKAGIDMLLEPNIIMASVVFLSTPLDESVGPYAFLNAVSPAQVTNLEEPLNFTAEFTNQQSTLFDKYQSVKTFIAILTLDTDGKPVHYSSTVLLP